MTISEIAKLLHVERWRVEHAIAEHDLPHCGKRGTENIYSPLLYLVIALKVKLSPEEAIKRARNEWEQSEVPAALERIERMTRLGFLLSKRANLKLDVLEIKLDALRCKQNDASMTDALRGAAAALAEVEADTNDEANHWKDVPSRITEDLTNRC